MTTIIQINRFLIIIIFAVISTSFSKQFCYGQRNQDNKIIYNKDESFLNLPDGVIKSEIAFFNLKSSDSSGYTAKIKVNKIAHKSCTDSTAFFSKGNIYIKEILVGISSENIDQKSRIKTIYYGKYKYGFVLPDSIVNDIYDPVFCHEYSKRNKPIKSDCKVYQSEDKRRVYIYMLNGKGEERYEVIWIIQDDQYYSRVIDVI